MEKIGNIRSVRHYYVPVGLEWDSIIVHFGGPYYADAWVDSLGLVVFQRRQCDRKYIAQINFRS